MANGQGGDCVGTTKPDIGEIMSTSSEQNGRVKSGDFGMTASDACINQHMLGSD